MDFARVLLLVALAQSVETLLRCAGMAGITVSIVNWAVSSGQSDGTAEETGAHQARQCRKCSVADEDMCTCMVRLAEYVAET
jgi:hypothetical protein